MATSKSAITSGRWAWRDDDGKVHATVYVSESSATAFFFDSPADARAMAAICTEAAEAMEALEPEEADR